MLINLKYDRNQSREIKTDTDIAMLGMCLSVSSLNHHWQNHRKGIQYSITLITIHNFLLIPGNIIKAMKHRFQRTSETFYITFTISSYPWNVTDINKDMRRVGPQTTYVTQLLLPQKLLFKRISSCLCISVRLKFTYNVPVSTTVLAVTEVQARFCFKKRLNICLLLLHTYFLSFSHQLH